MYFYKVVLASLDISEVLGIIRLRHNRVSACCDSSWPALCQCDDTNCGFISILYLNALCMLFSQMFNASEHGSYESAMKGVFLRILISKFEEAKFIPVTNILSFVYNKRRWHNNQEKRSTLFFTHARLSILYWWAELISPRYRCIITVRKSTDLDSLPFKSYHRVWTTCSFRTSDLE